mgnify:CR=1 FL=1
MATTNKTKEYVYRGPGSNLSSSEAMPVPTLDEYLYVFALNARSFNGEFCEFDVSEFEKKNNRIYKAATELYFAMFKENSSEIAQILYS